MVSRRLSLVFCEQKVDLFLGRIVAGLERLDRCVDSPLSVLLPLRLGLNEREARIDYVLGRRESSLSDQTFNKLILFRSEFDVQVPLLRKDSKVCFDGVERGHFSWALLSSFAGQG